MSLLDDGSKGLAIGGATATSEVSGLLVKTLRAQAGANFRKE